MTERDHEHEHEHEHVHLTPEEYVQAFRSAKDEWMRGDPASPLPEDQRATFTGLSYYPFDESLVLELPLDRDVPDEPVIMQTSTGGNREYHRAGKIHFEVDGQEVAPTVYVGPEGELFLPVRDATSGNETYGAGRYLEPDLLDENTVLADFNLLYNPFCAYNEHYSCPLPPIENWLRVPIRSGEKIPGGLA